MDPDNFCKGYDFEEMFCFQGGIEPYFLVICEFKINKCEYSVGMGEGRGSGFRICFHYDLPSRYTHVEYK